MQRPGVNQPANQTQDPFSSTDLPGVGLRALYDQRVAVTYLDASALAIVEPATSQRSDPGQHTFVNEPIIGLQNCTFDQFDLTPIR